MPELLALQHNPFFAYLIQSVQDNAIFFLLHILTFVALFLSWVWLRLQPQPYFLHLTLATAMGFSLAMAKLLPPSSLQTVNGGQITLLSFITALYLTLAFAPHEYAKSTTLVKIRSVVRRRIWLLAAVLVLIAAGIAADLRVPGVAQKPGFFYSWLGAMALMLSGGGWLSFRNFRKSRTEMLVYSAVLLVFALAAFASLFIHPLLGFWPAILGFTLIIWQVLLYHSRFIGLEAELRSGLYEENLALREENQRKNTVLEIVREAVLQLERDETVIYANTAFTRVTGIEHGKVQGKKFRQIVGKELYQTAMPALKSAQRGKEAGFEIMLHRQDGSDVALSVHAQPILNNRNKVRGIHLGFFDMTEAIRLHDNLKTRIEQQERDLELYRSAIDKTADAIVLTDVSSRIIFANSAFTRITGYSQVDLVGRLTSHYRLDSRDEQLAIQRLKQGKTWRGRFQSRRKDGSLFTADVTASPIVEKNGDLRYVLWTENDAQPRQDQEKMLENLRTELAEKEMTLFNIKQEYMHVFSALETGVILVRPDGACRYLNDAAGDLLGYHADEISLEHLPEFVRDLLRIEASYGKKIRAKVTDYVDVFQRPDGKRKPLRWRAMPVALDDESLGIVLQIFDNTEQASREEKLTHLEKQLAKLQADRAENAQSQLQKLQHILQVAEMVNLQIDLDTTLKNVISAVQAVGWPRVLLYRKDSNRQVYVLEQASGLKNRQRRSMQLLRCELVDQYLVERFAVGSGFFLRHAEMGEALKEFMLPSSIWEDAGAWHPQDVLLLPAFARGKQTGLMLLGAPASGAQPDATSLQDLERLALQTASAVDHEQQRRQQAKRSLEDKLLVELSKIQSLDITPEREIEQIVAHIRPAFEAEACVIAYGPPAFGACTRTGPRRSLSIVALESPYVDRIIAEIEPLLPEKGARSQVLEQHAPGLISSTGLAAKGAPVYGLFTVLRTRSVQRGMLCCIRENVPFTQEEKNFAEEVANRVTLLMENSRLFADIESKAQELEKANTLISEFLANVSHELRTPLHAILSYVELMKQKENLDMSERERHLATIQNSGQKLLRLINDLLDLSKIEAGKVEPVIEVFSPRSLIRQVEEEIAPLCRESGLELRVETDMSLPPYARSDPALISRVLLNLARNAQKFTEHGSVEIAATMLPNKVLRLQVKDTGIGIPREKLDIIFEPFRQLDPHTSRQYEGSGLGLAISGRIVELLDGTINVKSTPGQGTLFTVEIPVQPLSRKPRDFRSQPARSAPRKKSRRKPLHSCRILLVDDDSSTQEAMRFLLENEGYQVEFASDGPTAITQAQHMRPDIIFLDIMMPGMDGYQVVHTLKSQKQLKAIPVIALTARAMADDREKARRAGFDDFLMKPFAMEDFFYKIEAYTNGGSKKR